MDPRNRNGNHQITAAEAGLAHGSCVVNLPPPLFNKKVNRDGFVSDAKCIMWVLMKSIDTGTTTARFIPEVTWHLDIHTTPLEKLYDDVLESFNCSSGCPMVIPKLRNEAYLGAKALLHLAIQRKCFGNGTDEVLFKSVSSRHLIMGSKHHEGDLDLGSTLCFIDCIFGDSELMDWRNFSFTIPHRAWMAHILLFHAQNTTNKGNRLTDDIKQFVHHTLQLHPSPPAQVTADCLFIAGLILGFKLHVDDLSVVDKR